MSQRYLLTILIIIILAIILQQTTVQTPVVNNFQECVQAGNPVMESYPRQCRHNGQLFIEEIRTECTPESRRGDACIEIYAPVCGYFDPEKIICIKEPCAATYSNSCFACLDENVRDYEPGECPI